MVRIPKLDFNNKYVNVCKNVCMVSSSFSYTKRCVYGFIVAMHFAGMVWIHLSPQNKDSLQSYSDRLSLSIYPLPIPLNCLAHRGVGANPS